MTGAYNALQVSIVQILAWKYHLEIVMQVFIVNILLSLTIQSQVVSQIPMMHVLQVITVHKERLNHSHVQLVHIH